MSSSSTVNFSQSDQGLFSPQEIQRLMQIEFDRAVRYEYPAAAMLIEVDRLEYLHDLYGWESREEVLGSVIQLLRSTTRDSDFLACMQGNRILSLFPHADDRTIQAIAGRLLHICRELEFRIDARSIRATLSIGVSIRKPGVELDFGDFLHSAHEAVGFAVESGGDRYVRREPAIEVIQELRDEIDDEVRLLAEESLETAISPSPRDLEVEQELEHELRALLVGPAALSSSPGGALDPSGSEFDLASQVVRVALEGVRRARELAVGRTAEEHQEKVDLLERRLAKLRGLLDSTERELGRVMSSHGGESGMASIYRTVQGLQGDEQAYETKKEMLTLIFEANLELKRIRERKP